MVSDITRHTSIPNGWLIPVRLNMPSLRDNTADCDRLHNELSRILDVSYVDIDIDLLRSVTSVLQAADFNVECLVFKDKNRCRLIELFPSKSAKNICGLAIDLGTTRVVMRLLNMKTSAILHELTFDNPQIKIGADILTRIHYTDHPNGLKILNELIIEGINENIYRLCKLCNTPDISPKDIYVVTVAGNTAMTHLFMNLEPQRIIREPYIPVVNSPGLIKTSDLGIKVNTKGMALIFPNVGSYFGGDLIAGILASELYKRETTAILVDVGTNAEVVLGNKDWMLACAGAAGPALEGGVTKIGMTAASGAIERVSYDKASGKFDISTIDNAPPIGICGSGVIDLAASLFKAGMLDIRGKFLPDNCGSRLKERDGMYYFQIVSSDMSGNGNELTITQADIDSLIRSKAAMYTILTTITGSVGMMLSELPVFYVAGTFGAFINPLSAITIGMIPDLPIERYKTIGNSSLDGATIALRSIVAVSDIYVIRDRITYMELNVNQEFMNRFSAAKFLPHTDRSLFPSVNL